MIDEIRVENLALIREASLVPCSGLTVLTGETGAGKTALLSALKLLMGERADASSVREGEAGLVVEGRFFKGADDPEGFGVVRSVSADGRSRVKIDGSISSVRELATRVGSMIDLCGQHEHQSLLDSANHVRMVDSWAADTIAPILDDYRAKLHVARAAAAELARVTEASRSKGALLDEARFTVERISEVDPRLGEYEELEESLPRAEHAEALASAANDAQSLLSEENAALDSLNGAIAELQRMAGVDKKLSEFADSLAEASILIEDAAADLRRYRDSVDFDPEELARQQDRFAQLKGLLRQYGPTMDDVFARLESSKELLSLVDDAEERVKRARLELDAAESDLVQAARALMKARTVAGPRFCREVVRQMARLEMGGAEVLWDERELPRERWTDSGPSICELLYRSGSGLTPRPLKRIASGGELSRVLLAAKVVMGSADHAGTLVFDEVDAGVGGATARSLATVLADLAKTHQVIVVTHLAQVAVVADAHYVVRKADTGSGIPETSLVPVEGDERVAEIARMLSGDSSPESLAHARAMLESL
ncbi:DNA repair protein RecN [Collinsella tanakaei]|uniref:DNA repair protein RecN n=1 Tax=Collinsella tanakaei TaxID=626935 RepID=UPI002943A6E3|nr:DNA repair protein RecN [Collinsella tanakaei]